MNHRTRSPLAIVVLSLLSLTRAHAQPAPPLGSAAAFAVIGGSTVTNTGPSVITAGHLGVDPGTAITGFPPGVVVGGAVHAADATAHQAQIDLVATMAAIDADACTTDLTGMDLGGMTLTPGVYCFGAAAQLTGTLTLDGLGNPGAVFIFKIGSTLTTSVGAAVTLINGAQSCGVHWKVGSSATIGVGTAFAGNLLAVTSITLNAGANVTGRVLAQNGAVTLDGNQVSVAACGSSIGDPHLRTFDGLAYDFQAAADFILVRTAPIEAQVRQSFLPTKPTIAVLVGAAARVGTDRVAVLIAPLRIFVNGVASTLGPTPVILPGGATASYAHGVVLVEGPLGSVGIVVRIASVDVRVGLAPSVTDVVGLLGNRDGRPGNDIIPRGGTALTLPVTLAQRYDVYGVTWVVPDAESMFAGLKLRTGAPPAYSAASQDFSVADLPSTDRIAAERTCQEAGIVDATLLSACTLDVALLGDTALAKGFLGTEPPSLTADAAPARATAGCSVGTPERGTGILGAVVFAALGALRARRRSRLA